MLRHLALLEDSEEFVEQPWTAAELVEDLRWRQLAGEHRLAPLRLPPSPSLPALSFFYFFSSGRATRRALQASLGGAAQGAGAAWPGGYPCAPPPTPPLTC